ncbi:hypothetical protein [Prosthecobacter sp.]|uniref:hypothetical protein n=1 Tax=Prosthecobacter sp. TaxID=1965333 RepID=UPI001D342F0A|nr:hypothetical protein [Prosthecobacter sp.]MCB1274993.1 hypothetical protein [Prosthecobacter sp.]
MLPKLSRILSTVVLVGMTLAAVRAQAQMPSSTTTSSGWRISSGPQWRSVGRLHWNPGASQSLVTINGTTTFSGLPPGVYDNGFVLPDNLNNGVTTSNFGWDATTVVDVFQDEGFEFELLKTDVTTTNTATLFASQQGGASDRLNGPGFFIKLESPALWKNGGWELSLEFGYSLTGMRLSQLRAAFAGLVTQTISTTTISDLYGGNDFGVSPGPGSTYTGSPAGGATIPIAPIAHTEDTVTVMRAIVVDSAYNRSFGLDLHTLSLGPHLNYQSPDGRFQAGFSTGLAVNFAFWNVDTVETLLARGGGSLGAWGYHSSGSKVLPGFYLQANLAAQISERWYAMLAGRYDYTGTLHGGSGPTEFSLDLSGWTVMTGLTYIY